ncbi:hypothetical protein AT6N2_C0103 [Agrobacterium tumefaciens]|nr:hypothetical protein AT6N2_C0103 [Agrobacterium tumefaciens]
MILEGPVFTGPFFLVSFRAKAVVRGMASTPVHEKVFLHFIIPPYALTIYAGHDDLKREDAYGRDPSFALSQQHCRSRGHGAHGGQPCGAGCGKSAEPWAGIGR